MAAVSLVFDILARDKASSEFRKVGDAAETVGKKASGMSSGIKRAMGIAAGAIAAAGIGTMLKDSISLAAAAEQSLGGVQAVFKGYADTVVNSSKGAAKALGLSQNSYRELATVIGAQLKNAGVPMDELAGKTDGLVTMGADLAAMFGGTTADAVNALSSALKGEMDPIEKYGISLNDAALKAEAMALGIYNGKGPLDASAKSMAVMSLVTKQGADAVGAFGRESDTAAGRQARATAQWENLRTTIGQKLLPAFSALMDFVSTKALPAIMRFGGWLSDKLSPIIASVFDYIRSTAIPAAKDFASWVMRNRDVIIPVVAALGAMLAAFKAFMFIKTVIAAVAAFNAVLLANPIGLVVAAIAGLIAILVVAYQKSETFRKIVDKAFRVVADAGKWMWENVLKPVFGALRDAWDKVGSTIDWVWTRVVKPVFNAFRDVGETVRKAFATAVDGIKKVWEGVKSILKAPIQAVIDVVWNNGLRKMWNLVNNLWGGDDLDRVSLATGGVMPGYTPGRDVHSFYSPTGGRLDLSGGEAVMRPEWTRVLGKPTVDYWNQVARQEGEAGLRRVLADGVGSDVHQHFAKGGVVLPGWLNTALSAVPGGGTVKNIISAVNGADLGGGLLGGGLWSMVKGIAGKLWSKAKGLWDDLMEPSGITGASAPGGGSGLGSTYASIFAAVKRQFPEARLNSGFRLGDPGYHGLGRAADLGQVGRSGGNGHPYLAAMNQWLYDNYGGSLAELIYTGAGDNRPDIKNGRRHVYSQGVVQTHRNHVHVAVRDKGGLLPPGMNMIWNGTGKNETIRNAEQERALRQPLNLKVFIGDRELTDIVRVEAEGVVVDAFTGSMDQSQYRP